MDHHSSDRFADERKVGNPKIEKQSGLTQEQINAALQRIGEQLTSEAEFDELVDTLIAWSVLDPEAALAYVRRQLKLDRQNQAITRVLTEWTKRDPEAAWKWASANVATNGTHIDAVLSQIGKTDAAVAWRCVTEFAQAHPAEARSAYVSALRGMTYAGNFEAATRFLQQADLPAMPDGTEGKYALGDLIASEWGRHDPEKAAEWVKGLPADSIARERALVNLGQAWADVEPQAAAEFAIQLPPGRTRAMVMTQAIPNWAEHDPAAAAQWLNQFDPSPDFDQAINRIATHPDAMKDVNAAVTWANSIFDTELQVQTLTRILANWKDRDAAAAFRYLETSAAIPPDTRMEVRRRIEANDLYATREMRD